MNWKDERDKLLLDVPRTPSKFLENLKNLSDLYFRVKLKVRVEDADERIPQDAPYLEGINFDRPETHHIFILIRRYFWAVFALHFVLLLGVIASGNENLVVIRLREMFQELSIVIYIFLNFYLWMYDRKFTGYAYTDKPGVAISVDGRLEHIFEFNFEKYLKQLLKIVPEEALAGLSYIYVSYSSEHEEMPMRNSLGYYFPGTSPYIVIFAKSIWDHCPEHVDAMPFFFDILFARILYEEIGYHTKKITPPDPVRAKEAETYGTMMFRRNFYGRGFGCIVRYFRMIFKIGVL